MEIADLLSGEFGYPVLLRWGKGVVRVVHDADEFSLAVEEVLATSCVGDKIARLVGLVKEVEVKHENS